MTFTSSLSYTWVALIDPLGTTSLLNRSRIRDTLGNRGEIDIRE